MNKKKVEVADKLYSNNAHRVNKKIMTDSTAKTLAKTALFGSYGAKMYDTVKDAKRNNGKKVGRALAGLVGAGTSFVNAVTINTIASSDYRSAVSKRKVVTKGTKAISAAMAAGNIARGITTAVVNPTGYGILSAAVSGVNAGIYAANVVTPNKKFNSIMDTSYEDKRK